MTTSTLPSVSVCLQEYLAQGIVSEQEVRSFLRDKRYKHTTATGRKFRVTMPYNCLTARGMLCLGQYDCIDGAILDDQKLSVVHTTQAVTVEMEFVSFYEKMSEGNVLKYGGENGLTAGGVEHLAMLQATYPETQDVRIIALGSTYEQGERFKFRYHPVAKRASIEDMISGRLCPDGRKLSLDTDDMSEYDHKEAKDRSVWSRGTIFLFYRVVD